MQTIATTITGVAAVIAPTAGPVVGGWITKTFSWHWLFLINVVPGIVAAAAAAFTLPRERPDFERARHLDMLSLLLMSCSLVALEIAIKEAPQRSWTSPLVDGLLALSLVTGFTFVRRTLRSPWPLVELRTFRDRNFAVGCLLSFVLGIGLFGSVYLMPVFLAYGQNPAVANDRDDPQGPRRRPPSAALTVLDQRSRTCGRTSSAKTRSDRMISICGNEPKSTSRPIWVMPTSRKARMRSIVCFGPPITTRPG
jgi:MFS family permease